MQQNLHGQTEAVVVEAEEVLVVVWEVMVLHQP
jgi:hypothetical protein